MTRRHLAAVAIAFTMWSAPLAACGLAAEPLTAIDVLLLPGQTMIDRANADNARLRANYPPGYSLDAEHRPHISLLQQFVRTKDLDAVYAAVERVFDEQQPIGWELEATGYFYVDFNDMALAGIVVRPTPQLRALQQAILDAVRPYTVPTGTAAAFAPPTEGEVNSSTVDYVDKFVPNEIGEHYGPHVTIGVGHFDFINRMKTEPFKPFRFKVAGAAVFHLGNYGTAARPLWSWEHTAAE